MEEAKNKNPDDENADLFSILGQLERYRRCSGIFHFKLCYPELAENFTFPCNEWTQFNNPVSDSMIKDFQEVKLTFKDNFQGIGMNEIQKWRTLINHKPFEYSEFFSIGAPSWMTEVPGPYPIWVGKVELYVNPGDFLSMRR